MGVASGDAKLGGARRRRAERSPRSHILLYMDDVAPEPEPAAANAGSSASLPPAPKTIAGLIKEALTTEPLTSEEVHARVVELAGGAYVVPSLNMVQSALQTRGDTFAIKVPPPRGAVGARVSRWVAKPPEEEKSSSSKKGGSKKAGGKAGKGGVGGGVQKSAKSGRALKPSQKKKAEEAAARKAELEHQAQLRRVDDVIARPMTAFVLFGLSQRGVLKKQKSAAEFKEVVKAIGERWALLSDDDRAKYDVMAEEDQRRSDSQAEAREAAAKAAAEAAAAAAAAEEQAAQQGADDEGGDGGEEEEGDDADDEEGGGGDRMDVEADAEGAAGPTEELPGWANPGEAVGAM